MANGDASDVWGKRLAAAAARAKVPGAVLGIFADGRQILAAHGVLSTATGVKATTESVFQIGSLTKVWTATMILQLAGEGRLSLDSTVAQLLPGVRIGEPDVSGEVTVRHLLTHSSGIDGDIFTDTGRGTDCLERYTRLLASAPCVFPPGTAFSYCNSGFVLLGRVIEVLDGREWDESLRQRLVRPLGLTRTVTLPEDALLHRAAVGHGGYGRESEPVRTWCLPRSVGPAGLITASAADVLSFARMHLDGGVAGDGSRILPEGLAASMRQPTVAIPVAAGDAMGLGWRLETWQGRQVFGHDGDTIGQRAYLRVEPQSRVAACLLTNSPVSQPMFRELFSGIFSELAGIAMPADPEPAAQAAPAQAGRHAGRYERRSRRFEVSLREGQLHMVCETTGDLAELTGQDREDLVLYPADDSGDNFVCRSTEREPWVFVSFRDLPDRTPCLFVSRRATPRVG